MCVLGPPLLTQLNRSALTSRGMCVNWNELQYLACATVESQPVATRLPGVRLPVVNKAEINILNNVCVLKLGLQKF